MPITAKELMNESLSVQASPTVIPSFLELEITGFCQLKCVHCYAESGPHGGHGTMTAEDWEKVIDQAAEIGIRMIQFIGGEPTGVIVAVVIAPPAPSGRPPRHARWKAPLMYHFLALGGDDRYLVAARGSSISGTPRSMYGSRAILMPSPNRAALPTGGRNRAAPAAGPGSSRPCLAR